jgi:hypothetical protein
MGPVVAIPEDVRIFVQWHTRAQISNLPPNKNTRQRLRRAVRAIRRANLDLWPSVATYDKWKLAEWHKLSEGGGDGLAT